MHKIGLKCKKTTRIYKKDNKKIPLYGKTTKTAVRRGEKIFYFKNFIAVLYAFLPFKETYDE